jgi:hypothetical protein
MKHSAVFLFSAALVGLVFTGGETVRIPYRYVIAP